jgi:hypothetical protein
LSHPEREAANAVVRDIGEADPLERVIDASRAVAPEASQGGEVLARGKRGIQARSVHEPGNPRGESERPAHRAAEDRELAAVGLGQTEEQGQQRRLPGPVGSDEAVDLPWRDVEVDAVERDDLAKGLDDSARTDGERLAPIIDRRLLRPGRLGGRRPAGAAAGRRLGLLSGACPETRQFVSELGIYAPGTPDGG